MSKIKAHDNSISFQDLRSIKRTFDDYFKREITLNKADEKKIIFYQQCRHNIVHASGIVDDIFLERLLSQDANVKNYSPGDKIKLDEDDWKQIKLTFAKLISVLTDEDKWTRVLQAAAEYNNSLFAILRLAEPIYSKDRLLLKFQFVFHQKRINDPKTFRIVESIVKDIYGKRIELKITNK